MLVNRGRVIYLKAYNSVIKIDPNMQVNKNILLDQDAVGAVAALLETVATDRFPTAMKRAIRLFCAFDSMIVTRYPAGAPPVSLYQDLNDMQAAISVNFYATGPYLLDPLYLACKNGRPPGVYRTLELAPESFFRSEYYRTFYRKIRIGDELGLLIQAPDNVWIILSLARLTRRSGFEVGEIDQLRALFPVIASAVLRHWMVSESSERADESALMEDKLDTFGLDILSPREAEIIRLVLQGHSTPSAAAYLGISEGTVKVHRHHAYTKLGISSQSELFSMATRHFFSEPT